jgi:multidrug efflux system membrane fusion protein
MEGGSDGQYVFVVKDDRAVVRTVVVARTSGDDDVIASGLRPGELVVTDGQAQLEDGKAVEVMPANPAAEPHP